jgi:beta-carotene 3-hydroxylase
MIVSIILSFCSMELIAWFMHKYVMHGFLWEIHKDHHNPDGKLIQKNDFFFLIFAIPSWLCIMLGMIYLNDLSVGIGIGIAIYGLAYFLVHEVLIHRRLNWFDGIDNKYIQSIKRAHRAHHEKTEKKNGKSFGLLIFPLVYFK